MRHSADSCVLKQCRLVTLWDRSSPDRPTDRTSQTRGSYVLPRLVRLSCLACQLLSILDGVSAAQALTPVSQPSVTSPIVVASPAQRLAAGAKAQPPLTDTFDWPDTPLGVIKTSDGYEFFGSDGGGHYRQMRQGHWVGNNKSGSFTPPWARSTIRSAQGYPHDVSVSPNPDPSVNPNYSSYTYMGGGPVYQVPRACLAPATCWLLITRNFPTTLSTRLSGWPHRLIMGCTGPILEKLSG